MLCSGTAAWNSAQSAWELLRVRRAAAVKAA